MRTTKIAVLPAVLALLGAGLAGCATAAPSGEGSGDAQKLELILGLNGMSYYETLACGAKEAAAGTDVVVNVSAANQWAVEAQTTVLNAALSRGPNTVAIVPVDPNGLAAPLGQATAQGIKVIAADQSLDPSITSQATIVSDNLQGGQLAGEAAVEALAGQGKVLVIAPPPGASGEDARVDGFVDVAEAGGLTLVDTQYAADQTAAAAAVSASLSANPDLAAVYATNEYTLLGAVSALKTAQLNGTVKAIGVDASQAEVDALNAGDVYALVAQQPEKIGELVVEQMIALNAGETVEQTTAVPMVLLTKDSDDLDEYVYEPSC
ncbi:substrate-binding domain-containing protein [Agromyces sp. NBRC 114283]|uniref:substrate-binding domain-containing protein n=1 Tax=Agromyces sp. NBRC 114283 TaxID=2994521 RepID=UPI0024A3519B|nr:substrate-binding domain-containing protein [Agromyces sp. NBRC 114283]GLU89703.1 LacI family transcriptional regulator [Agromyces sp. NBRC 114283]